jgi:hypothetical protein
MVPGYPGYCVTRTGMVFSQHVQRCRSPLNESNQWTRLTGRTPNARNGFRVSFRLKSKSGAKHGMQCGVIVLLAWRGIPDGGMECCHNDGNPLNNNLENLRWDTRSGNQSDRIKHGTHQNGERNCSAKLTEEQVKSIIESNEPQKVIASRFGISRSTIYSIKTGRRWSHLNAR